MHRRITKTYFRTCSTHRCRSQAGLNLYAFPTISIRRKPTFVPLRYNLAGYRPSKTAQQTLFPLSFPDNLGKPHIFQRVVLHCRLAAPTYPRQSKNMKAKSTCSKAPRGLFVHVEVGRVFTAIAISPSKPSRQLLARYAIHAGQNLPGKELRYLRTVIVTAAVHRSLTSKQLSYDSHISA